jgi:glycosyl transferase-like sugar-binding protein
MNTLRFSIHLRVLVVLCLLPASANAYKKNDTMKKLNLSIFSVDFEEAMGKNDPYMKPFYENFRKAFHDPNTRFFRCVTPYSPVTLMELCKKLYNENKPLIANLGKDRIPRVFHQIWVGGRPFPEKYKEWQKTWQSVPGWNYKLWTDKDVETFEFPNKDRYYREKNMGARADILRLAILEQFGGVYIDTDFECLKPEYFNLLNSSYDFFAGFISLDLGELQIANGIIGSIPHHPILVESIKTLATLPEGNAGKDTLTNNGPGLITKMILLHANKVHRDVVFPCTYFLPLGRYQMNKQQYKSMPNNIAKLEKLKLDSCRPESLAIHWWEGSWKLPDAWEKN